jgi:pimeloyl-ACP methyl ester carboxylesterase
MQTLIVAIHGILTSQTDPSWPDKFDAWMYRRDPRVRVLKKEYVAGPFPRWNCWVKDPLLARGLANEIELFLDPVTPAQASPPIWLVAHSNGAVIALLTLKRLIARGRRIGGVIFTGAACEADIEKNGVLEWQRDGMLAAAISYSSRDDQVLAGDPRFALPPASRLRDLLFRCLCAWLWGKLMWPYGCLGRTGWLRAGKPCPPESPDPEPSDGETTTARPIPSERLFTRWYAGGHCAYFRSENITATFEQIYRDINLPRPLP